MLEDANQAFPFVILNSQVVQTCGLSRRLRDLEDRRLAVSVYDVAGHFHPAARTDLPVPVCGIRHQLKDRTQQGSADRKEIRLRTMCEGKFSLDREDAQSRRDPGRDLYRADRADRRGGRLDLPDQRTLYSHVYFFCH